MLSEHAYSGRWDRRAACGHCGREWTWTYSPPQVKDRAHNAQFSATARIPPSPPGPTCPQTRRHARIARSPAPELGCPCAGRGFLVPVHSGRCDPKMCCERGSPGVLRSLSQPQARVLALALPTAGSPPSCLHRPQPRRAVHSVVPWAALLRLLSPGPRWPVLGLLPARPLQSCSCPHNETSIQGKVSMGP